MEESNWRMRIAEKFAFDFVLELIRSSPRCVGCNVLSEHVSVIESSYRFISVCFSFLEFLFRSFVFRSLFRAYPRAYTDDGLLRFTKRGKRADSRNEGRK